MALLGGTIFARSHAPQGIAANCDQISTPVLWHWTNLSCQQVEMLINNYSASFRRLILLTIPECLRSASIKALQARHPNHYRADQSVLIISYTKSNYLYPRLAWKRPVQNFPSKRLLFNFSPSKYCCWIRHNCPI
ncbi:conserved hypothetical protein [Trichinella spiralis]|uniref:hypothetical protein n=1 Tax=Trichinella spiralis TaxID=6334 RepID=UPI0001EFD716|nr:conserved hypothetical protein [Trichinella spiralis]